MKLRYGYSEHSLWALQHNDLTSVKLREHPLMSHNGFRSWPPLWVCLDDKGIVQAEVGKLARVRMLNRNDCRISLRMHNDGHEYLAHLLLDDQNFCLQIYALLQNSVGKAITEIGDLQI